SFSDQVYQRCTCAPDPVRASITQELTDITTLLQHDTPFETVGCSTPDLDCHLDNLYENHQAEQAITKDIAEKQAQERAAAEKERLEEQERVEKEKQAKAVADAKQKEEEALEAAAAKQEQQHDEQLDHKRATSVDDNDSSKNITSKNDTDAVEKLEATKTDATKTTADTDTDKKSIQETANVVNGANDHNMKTVIDKAVSDAAIPLSLKDTKLGASHPELIRELEMHVDDYLSEQMMQISENLKSWLRAELAQHLTEPDTTTTIKSNENIAKKNIH